MKIAVFHELPKGGARRVVNDFSKELLKKHQVDLYTVSEERLDEERKYFSKVFLYKFHPKEWKGNNWKTRLYKDTIELNKLRNLHKEIAEKIDKKKYDVVIIHPSKFTQAPFVLKFIKTIKIYYAHEAYRIMYEKYFQIKFSSNLLKDLYEYTSRFLKKTIDRANVKCAPIIFVNSENTRRSILKYYARKSVVCYPGVDIDLFSLGKSKRKNDILFVGGTNDNSDGFFDLKRAIDLIKKKITLKVVGNGGEWIDDKILHAYYKNSKVVFCGAQNEPFGLVPLEAGASGCTVVAISEGGYKESFVKGISILTSRKPDEISKALLKAFTKKKYGSSRKELVRRWSLKVRTKKLEKEILSLIKQN